jgi:hypothetical protein
LLVVDAPLLEHGVGNTQHCREPIPPLFACVIAQLVRVRAIARLSREKEKRAPFSALLGMSYEL